MAPKQAPSRVDYNTREFGDFQNRDPSEVSERCRQYANIGDTAEFIIPHYAATVVGVIDYPASDQQVYDAVYEAQPVPPESFIDVHETVDDNVDDIVVNGFDKDELGSNTINEYEVRENAVYTWHHITQMSNQDSNVSGVLVSAPRHQVTVSDMPIAVTVDKQTYLEDMTMKYPDYIHCLKKLGPQSPVTFEEDIIQDISSYGL